MNKIMRIGISMLAVMSLVFYSSPAFAKGPGSGKTHTGTPSGFNKGEKKGWKGESTPPGWSKGKKKGWDGASMPPGQAKKQED